MISIAALAKAAKVSPATVTRVIHENGYVSNEKRAAVLQAIDELGYIPNQLASKLRRGKSNYIGFVIPELSENPFYTRFSNAFNKAAQNAEYQVLSVITHHSAEQEKQLVMSLVGMLVEAVVFMGTLLTPDIIKTLNEHNVPVVMIEFPTVVENTDMVMVDNYRAAMIALEHIIRRGHKKIAYVGVEPSDNIIAERLRAFNDGMNSNSLVVEDHHLCIMSDYGQESGRQAACRLLDDGEPPTAILATSDVLACGILQELYHRGLKVPDDISLLGFDNTLSALTAPTLTSMELLPDLIGEAAVNMVIEKTRKKRIGTKKEIFTPVLIDRGSVKKI